MRFYIFKNRDGIYKASVTKIAAALEALNIDPREPDTAMVDYYGEDGLVVDQEGNLRAYSCVDGGIMERGVMVDKIIWALQDGLGADIGNGHLGVAVDGLDFDVAYYRDDEAMTALRRRAQEPVPERCVIGDILTHAGKEG